jgi:regulator of PEP synthase PpsR (kinase-PPPase family)
LTKFIDFRHLSDEKNLNPKDQFRIQLLNQLIDQVVCQPNYATLLQQALEEIEILDDFVNKFSRLLKLKLHHEIAVGISLTRSYKPKIQQTGTPSLQHFHLCRRFSLFL